MSMTRRDCMALLSVGAPLSVSIADSATAAERPSVARWLFTDLPLKRFDPEIKRIFTVGRTRTGSYAAAFRLDDSQAILSEAGQRILQRLAAANAPPNSFVQAQAAVAALEARFRVRTADGRWFTLDEARPVAGHFGAIGDGQYEEATGRFSGTDDTAAIQALIDWSLFWDRRTGNVDLGAGAFRLTRPLFVGRNTDYHSLTLAGDGAAYGPGFAGTRLLIDHAAGPAIAVTGMLNGAIRDMAMFGRAGHWIASKRLGGLDTPPEIDDTALRAWSSTPDGVTGERRYSPYAAIAIDPFRGNRPENGYDVRADVQPWLGQADMYGPEFSSSNVVIERVTTVGFNTGFVIQPSDSDGNGDFVRFRDCTVRACAWGWSVGNSQSRAVEMTACIASNVHTVLTTSTHGRRNGSLRSRITHLSIGNAIRVFAFENALATIGPLTFSNLYAEAIWSIGTLGSGTANDVALTFEDSAFAFDLIGRKGVPRALLATTANSGYGPGGSDAPIKFARSRFSGFGAVLPLLSAAVEFDDSLLDAPSAPLVEIPSDIARKTYAAIAGGLVTSQFRIDPDRARFRYNLDGTTVAFSQPASPGTRSIYSRLGSTVIFSKRALTKSRLAAGEWYFTARTDPAISPGDVLLDLTSGCIFVVRTADRSATGQQVAAVLQNDRPRHGEPGAGFDAGQGQVMLASVV